VKDKCISHVDVCTNWQNICNGQSAKQCKKYSKIENKNVCAVYGIDCAPQSQYDQECFTHCQAMQAQKKELEGLLKRYEESRK